MLQIYLGLQLQGQLLVVIVSANSAGAGQHRSVVIVKTGLDSTAECWVMNKRYLVGEFFLAKIHWNLNSEPTSDSELNPLLIYFDFVELKEPLWQKVQHLTVFI